MAFANTITITPGMSISLQDTSVLNSQPLIITPGQIPFKSTFTSFLAPLFTNSNTAFLNTPLQRPDGANFIPIFYVRNIDPTNPVFVQFSLIGLGATFAMQLFPSNYLFFWNPVGAGPGAGVGGIDQSTGVGIKAVAPAVNTPVELFYAG